MKTSLATKIMGGEEYSILFNARSQKEADRICAQYGWTFGGALIAEIPESETTVQQVAEMCDRRNRGSEHDA